MGDVDGVLDNVALGSKVGGDIDGRICDQKWFFVGRHIKHIDVAHAPFGLKTINRINNCVHQLVRMKGSLHDSIHLARFGKRDGGNGCSVAVRGVDDFNARKAFAGRFRRRHDF